MSPDRSSRHFTTVHASVRRLIILTGLCVSAAIAAAPDQGQHVVDTPSVFVEVQSDGQQCVIRNVAVPCAEVLTHLRQVLKLAPGFWVRFKADRAAPFEAVRKIMDEVAHSEFTTSVAYMRPSNADQKK